MNVGKIFIFRTDLDDFTAVSAQNYLKRLTGFGPRPAGSYANDVQAVEFLRYAPYVCSVSVVHFYMVCLL